MSEKANDNVDGPDVEAHMHGLGNEDAERVRTGDEDPERVRTANEDEPDVEAHLRGFGPPLIEDSSDPGLRRL